MKFFDGLMNQLFPEREDRSLQEKETLIREQVKQTDHFLTAYRNWKITESKSTLLDGIYCNYLKRLSGSHEVVNFYLHQSPQSNGFYFRAEKDKTVKEYSFLVQYFIEKLINQEYHKNNSVREIVEERDAVYVTETFYLRPRLKFKKQLPYEQLFGNASIEHRLKNGKTELVKVMLSTYDDHHYKPPFDFEDLMNELFVN